jgi:hypothetical protein
MMRIWSRKFETGLSIPECLEELDAIKSDAPLRPRELSALALSDFNAHGFSFDIAPGCSWLGFQGFGAIVSGTFEAVQNGTVIFTEAAISRQSRKSNASCFAFIPIMFLVFGAYKATVSGWPPIAISVTIVSTIALSLLIYKLGDIVSMAAVRRTPEWQSFAALMAEVFDATEVLPESPKNSPKQS